VYLKHAESVSSVCHLGNVVHFEVLLLTYNFVILNCYAFLGDHAVLLTTKLGDRHELGLETEIL
jgi:hypothetical protein